MKFRLFLFLMAILPPAVGITQGEEVKLTRGNEVVKSIKPWWAIDAESGRWNDGSSGSSNRQPMTTSSLANGNIGIEGNLHLR